jgi:hypothetical protein
MSNGQLTALTIALALAHFGVLGGVLLRRTGMAPMLGLNLALALVVLTYIGLHPRAFSPPADWQVVGLAGFEALVLASAVMAWRGLGVAVAGSWVGFAVHLLASLGAVALALLFKINRLI